MSMILSFLKSYDNKPVPSTIKLDGMDLSWELLSFHHLINAYLYSWLIFGTLLTCLERTTLGENMKGFDTYHSFHNPFFQSRSPTEFWTK